MFRKTQVQEVMQTQAVAAALFDVDGVLVDSKSAYIGFYNNVRNHVHLPAMTAAQELEIFAYTFEGGFEYLIPPPLRPRAREFVNASQFEDYLPRIATMPGAVEALRILNARGFRLGVCTNGARREVDIVFRTFGLLEHVHGVVTCDEAPRPKPNPDGLQLLLSMLDVPRERAVYIGDSRVDAQAAREAGIPFWAFGGPLPHALRVVRSMAEVVEALSGPEAE